MKTLPYEYRLIANQIAGLGVQIPVTLAVPKSVERSIELLCIQFDQLKIRDQNLELALPFSGLKDGKIYNVEAFSESADIYVDVHDSNICEALAESFAEEKRLMRTFKNPIAYARCMSALIAHRAELVESYEALGFKTIDRQMIVESEYSIDKISNMIRSNADLETSVDVKQIDDGFKIFYPHHMEKAVIEFIESNEEDFCIRLVSAFPNSVPGYKDIDDHLCRLQVKEELKEKPRTGHDFGLS